MSNSMNKQKQNLLDNMLKIRPMENYRFYLIIEKGQSEDDEDIKVGFSNVSSFGYDVEVEEISVGGINDRKIVLPKYVKSSNVTCERGLTDDDGLYKWLNEIKEGNYNKRNMLLIAFGSGMYNSDSTNNDKSKNVTRVRKVWSFEDAMPIKWEISGFDANGNSVVIEKLELNVENIKEISV